MIQILLTIAMLALMVFLLSKKVSPAMCMLGIAMITLLIYTAVSGQSILGDASIGNKYLDVFELIYTTASNSFKKNVLIVMAVMGYVSYMNYMKASEMFAVVVSKPIMMLKSPYIALIFGAFFTAILKIVIPSSVGAMALTLGTVYPIMRKCGNSVPACAATIIIGAAFVWGPADANSLMTFSAAGVDVNLTENFTKYQIPMFAAFFIPAIIIHFFTNKIFDKKEIASGKMVYQEDKTAQSAEELGVPKWFAILPILPLVIAIVFSKLVLKNINLSLVAAAFISLFIALICQMLAMKRGFVEEVNNTSHFFQGTGDYAGKSGWIIVAGSIYGTAVTAVGGVTILVNLLSSGGAGPLAFFIPLMLIAFVMGALVMQAAPQTTFGPLIAEYVATLQGANVVPLLQLLTESASIGAQFYPASSGILLLSSTSEVPVLQIYKRAFIPVFLGVVCMNIYTLALYLH